VSGARDTNRDSSGRRDADAATRGRTVPVEPEAAAPADAPTQPHDAPRIEGFRIVQLLGRGGFGTVWLALDAGGQRVAIKILDHDVSDIERQAYREYRNLCDAGADGLVLLGTMQQLPDGRLWYAMDPADDIHPHNQDPTRYEPASLHAWLKRHGPMPPEKVVELAEALLDGLGRLHAKGLLHRDVKPDNVLRMGGTWRLGDTGAIVHRNDIDRAPRVRTPEYAPTDGVTAPRDDLYGLGMLLYVALGNDVRDFPIPGHLDPMPEDPAEARRLTDLNRVMLTAADRRRGYESAERMRRDLIGARDDGGRFGGIRIVGSDRTLAAAATALVLVALLPAVVMLFGTDSRSSDTPPPQPPGAAPEQNATAWPIPRRHVLERLERRPGDEFVARGVLGLDGVSARAGEYIRGTLELDRPAWTYVVALNPDGSTNLCYPGVDDVAPTAADRIEFPRTPDDRRAVIGLTDGLGWQCFLLVLSSEPLGEFRSWHERHLADLALPHLPLSNAAEAESGLWEYDGCELRPVPAASTERGPIVPLDRAPPALDALVHRLADVLPPDGPATLHLIAFPVVAE